MLISFNILHYNIVQRNIDPIVACDKVKSATDIRFVCFDRMETEGELAFFDHTNNKRSNTLNKNLPELPGNLFSFSTITLKNIQST
ncbi:hypothetical protein SAMN04489864_104329 [Pedobacter insulae]|uniref:Uncharacterized protein n=1 Tax=Pedobacter insulae TaxID=414048 RepID=A0A1I2WWB0_9SPHI|nr:hypothetical protein SAMN04489864_104329 [Pedobacter insulae]